MLEQDQHGQLDNSQDRQDQQPRERGSMDNQQAPVTRTSGDMEDLEQNSDQRSQPGNGRTSNRGFAAMSPERQKQIASEGGRAAHRLGVAHEWSSEEARMAGRKGGQIVSQNREHMSEIGRRGGMSSGGRRNRQQNNNTESSE